jgi:hypothetical protein
VVLRESCHLAPAIDRHRQLVDPIREQALDVALPQREPVVVAGREVADVEADVRESRDLRNLPLREEAVGDAALRFNRRLRSPKRRALGRRQL